MSAPGRKESKLNQQRQPNEAPRVLVAQPDPQGGPDRLRGWALRHKIELDVRPGDHPDLPSNLDGYAGLIVLGGHMGDRDTAKYPWLQRLRELLHDARSRELPALGICLGAQLMASAFGGRVERGDLGFEAGVVMIRREEEAEFDPIFGRLPELMYSGAMHGDAITTLPKDAVLLATGEQYPHQAFRVGSCWGVQFHPEVSPAQYEKWVESLCAEDPANAESYRESIPEFQLLDDKIARGCSELAGNFFQLLGQHDMAKVGLPTRCRAPGPE